MHWVFPWGTLLVNVLGCLSIGLLMPILVRVNPDYRLFIVVGGLGAFTTWSFFSSSSRS